MKKKIQNREKPRNIRRGKPICGHSGKAMPTEDMSRPCPCEDVVSEQAVSSVHVKTTEVSM